MLREIEARPEALEGYERSQGGETPPRTIAALPTPRSVIPAKAGIQRCGAKGAFPQPRRHTPAPPTDVVVAWWEWLVGLRWPRR